MSYINNIKNDIKSAEKKLAIASTKEKNEALLEVAKSIKEMQDEILKANNKDITNARNKGISEAMIDRLALNEERIDSIIDGINTVIRLKDPVGNIKSGWTLENGLEVKKITVPIGTIAIIYESRPNVTVDAFALALKSGNTIILRGSSTAINSNIALEDAIKKGLEKSKISKNIIHLVKDNDRNIVKEILTANDVIDLAIPRGGASLINMVIENATVPVMQTGEGNNHIYIDESADLNMALNILINAKMQRVSVCNAAEKVILHKDIAGIFLEKLQNATKDKLELRADQSAKKFLPNVKAIENEDELRKEYLDYILGVKVVNDIDEAIRHINTYGTKHSEVIVTNNLENSRKFQNEVDAAVVYVNASSRFTDGGEFGFGAEMGISTQKMHARGPVGLDELVSYKYLVVGNGQVR